MNIFSIVYKNWVNFVLTLYTGLKEDAMILKHHLDRRQVFCTDQTSYLPDAKEHPGEKDYHSFIVGSEMRILLIKKWW